MSEEHACDIDVWRERTEQSVAVRETLDRIADKWSLIVISTLGPLELRFSELRREIPAISQRMLTVTLRGLERDGIVERHVRAVMPPHIGYSLTPLGASLMSVVVPLMDWARDRHGDVEASRARFDEHQDAVRRGDAPQVPMTSPERDPRERRGRLPHP